MSEPRFKEGDYVEDDHGIIGLIERVHPGENFPYRIREADGKLGSYSDYPALRLHKPVPDTVNHPAHYTSHPSGVECLTITRHMGFNLGNAVKYVWRADLKGSAIEDLEKAAFYIADEIAKRKAAK